MARSHPARRKRTPVDDIIDGLVAEAAPPGMQDPQRAALVRDMIATAVRLMRGPTDTGDAKILASALRELSHAFDVFRPYRHLRKVTAFGSARTRPGDPAYEQAREFTRKMAARGYMIITGAGPGIMRACQEGAGRDLSFGVNIRLPFEQQANEFISADPKLITFKYFFTRKVIFVKEAHALVLFPGGFGTHDEGFEALTLVQTGKTEPKPIVFLDAPHGTYWKTWKRYVEDHLLRKGLISDEDMHLFLVTDKVDEAVDEITRFYGRYHSSRYLDADLVIRLSEPLPPAALGQIESDFSDIISSGGLRQQSGPLPGEEDGDPQTGRLTRLVFRFNRFNFGRLRQLIDRLNRLERADHGALAAGAGQADRP